MENGGKHLNGRFAKTKKAAKPKHGHSAQKLSNYLPELRWGIQSEKKGWIGRGSQLGRSGGMEEASAAWRRWRRCFHWRPRDWPLGYLSAVCTFLKGSDGASTISVLTTSDSILLYSPALARRSRMRPSLRRFLHFGL